MSVVFARCRRQQCEQLKQGEHRPTFRPQSRGVYQEGEPMRLDEVSGGPFVQTMNSLISTITCCRWFHQARCGEEARALWPRSLSAPAYTNMTCSVSLGYSRILLIYLASQGEDLLETRIMSPAGMTSWPPKPSSGARQCPEKNGYLGDH